MGTVNFGHDSNHDNQNSTVKYILRWYVTLVQLFLDFICQVQGVFSKYSLTHFTMTDKYIPKAKPAKLTRDRGGGRILEISLITDVSFTSKA